MQKHRPAQFVAFGLLPLLNALVLALYGLELSTGGGHGEDALPVIIVLIFANLLLAMVSAVKRGLDLELAPWKTLLVFWLSLCLGPAVLLLLVYFCRAPSKCQDNAPADGAALNSFRLAWQAFLLLFVQWAALLMLSEIL